ncbi:MAG: radical SAM protein [Deltaproteobacteria bacterium]|nr:radical SAM protein [Deltaproteobacteria bacterium]
MDRRKVSSIALELTAYCNQKCAYCYNEWRDDGGQSIGYTESEKLFARIDRLLEAFELDHVTVTGGEPFAHKDVFRLFDRLEAAKVPIQIISNGGLIDDALAARLKGYDVRYVQCTLNAPSAELHADLVGGDGHFEATLEGVRALKRNGVPVVGCVVVTKKNAHLVSDILALWHELGVRQIAMSRFSPAGYATRAVAELLPTRDEMTVAFEQALPWARERGMRMSCTMPIPPCAVETERFAPIKFGSCPIGTSMQELALGPDGKLKNCTLHKTAIGGAADILEVDDLRALLDAPEITEYRKRLPAFCEGCIHASSCGGGCGAAAEWVLGDTKATPDPFLWQHIDDELAARLEDERTRASSSKQRRRLDVVA